jgi:hypothetical protein
MGVAGLVPKYVPDEVACANRKKYVKSRAGIFAGSGKVFREETHMSKRVSNRKGKSRKRPARGYGHVKTPKWVKRSNK